MPRFSENFALGKSQFELDFVDVDTNADIPLFIDPFAISQRPDRWSQDAHASLLTFFQCVIDDIRAGRLGPARDLLSHLREPNETRFGFSRGRPKGAGVGPEQADDIFNALRDSEAVRQGMLSALEECELMIPGIGPDKISDLTTNIIRDKLASYTAEQCNLHGIATRQVALPGWFDAPRRQWANDYINLPVVDGRPILLCPKAIARHQFSYDHRGYYRHYILDFLQSEHLHAGSALVHALKNGKHVVYKKDLEAIHPCAKSFLFEFSREHPDVLADYKEALSKLEAAKLETPIGDDDEQHIAAMLRIALAATPGGPDAAGAYHRLMVGVLEFVFFPDLVNPVKEREIHDGRKRIDIQMENSARSGPFYNLHAVKQLPCAYIAAECKNYTRELANPELDQIAGRFGPNRGKAGIVLCRGFENRERFVQRCRDTLTDGRGLIIGVGDEVVASWLEMIENGNRRDIRISVNRLIDEVFAH